MELKSDSHVFIGMERDMDIAKQKSEYLYDAYNIRINPREEDTLLGITNERGPLYKNSYSGKYVGHVVIDKEHIILFLTSANVIKYTEDDTIKYISTNATPAAGQTGLTDKDVIIKINVEDFSYSFLFIGNLNLDKEYPIQGIYKYESSHIKKIYWIDGLNQPRMINIEKEESSIEDNDIISTRFDFTQTLQLNEKVTVSKCMGGTFAPGVIQYAFSYFYLNGQETNIFYTTPLYYIGNKNTKTVNPEGKSNDAFKIDIQQLETKFDYLRIYSIHRTSWNATPECKIVADVKIESSNLTYIDYGNTGSLTEGVEMYYIGGQVIVPNTIAFKDATLFLANFKLDLNILRNATLTKEFEFVSLEREGLTSNDDSLHIIPKFKNGEHYLFGVQIQDKYGRWSDPVLLDEKTIESDKALNIVNCTISGLPSNAVKARGICIYPTSEQRNILATGVINPTLYQKNTLDKDHRVFQSSWFFRPVHPYSEPNYQFEHNTSIFKLGADSSSKHSYNDTPDGNNLVEIEGGGYDDPDMNFIISYNIVDFYSPDAEFDYLSDSSNSSFTLKYVGDISVNAGSPIDIVSLHQLRLDAASPFNDSIGRIERNTGITEYLFTHVWEESDVKKTDYFNLFPWTSSGSFTDKKGTATNQQTNTPFNTLNSNKLLRWITGDTIFSSNPEELSKCTYKSYLEENNNSLEFNGNYYLGQVETLLQTSDIDKYYKRKNNDDTWTNWQSKFNEKRIVEMKYKTCSHLVLSMEKSLYFNNLYSAPTDSPISNRTPISVYGFYNYNLSDNSKETLGNMQYAIRSRMEDYYGILNNTYPNLDDVYFDSEHSDTLFSKSPFYIIGRLDSLNKFYLFKVTVLHREIDGELHLTGFEIRSQSGNDENSVYIMTDAIQSTNLIYGYYDGNGEWKGASTIPNYSEYAGTYTLENGELKLYEGQTTPTGDDPVSENLDLGVQIPSTLSSNDSRLVLVDLVNDTPVPLQDDVPWSVASVNPSDVTNGQTTIRFDIGDTWLQDYYCIKTFPFTKEDDNSITEILQFKCPTRTNLIGRYSETIVPPALPEVNREKFSLINQVYSNQNNFFNYSKIKETETVLQEVVNSMTWCKENIPNSDTDSNTSISLLNNYIFDEKVTALITNNLSFYAFHPFSISKISFNPRVEVSPSDGIPIELSTSKKLYGSDTLVKDIGTSNKNAIIVTDTGVFFIDDNKRKLYLLGAEEKILGISDTKNFSSWFNAQEWLGDSRLFYDNINSDLYIVGNNDCLVFNSYLQEFVSFMSYEGIPSMFNVGYNFYAFDWYYDRAGLDDNYTSIYHMFNGQYNKFFGISKEVYLSFVSNPDSIYDKIFSTVESRMDVYSGNTLLQNNHFDYIRVWNEYQDTSNVQIETTPYNRIFTNTTGKKKFRIWRTDIPRDNNSMNRIRNTWTNIKLGFNAKSSKALVTNLNNTTNPNIAKYYDDIIDSNINNSNLEEHVHLNAPRNVTITNDEYRIILHDINVKYFI